MGKRAFRRCLDDITTMKARPGCEGCGPQNGWLVFWSCPFSRDTFHVHSFQGSFFLANLRKPKEDGWFLKRTMVEKNGTGINPLDFPFVFGGRPFRESSCFGVHFDTCLLSKRAKLFEDFTRPRPAR